MEIKIDVGKSDSRYQLSAGKRVFHNVPCRKLNLTPQKAFYATSLQLENAFSATRLLPEIKVDARKRFFRY